LKGLEAVIVRLKCWRVDNDALRLDSEYQIKAHRLAIERVRAFGAKQLKDDHPAIIHPQEIIREYVEEGTWFLRAQNVRPLKIDSTNQVLISSEDAAKLSRNEVRSGDVLVTRTGANRGQCAYFDRAETPIASSHTFIIRPRNVDPQFLAVFLNTTYGIAQINKGVYGAAQPEVAPYYLGNIWIPNVGSTLLSAVKGCLVHSRTEVALAETALSDAERRLAVALGLANWTPPDPETYLASSKSTLVAKRLDAEFFAPRIRDLMARLGHVGAKIGDVAPARHEKFDGSAPGSFDYIEISDLGGDGTVSSTSLDCADAPSRATWHVRTGDVVTSTVRPIRRLSALVEPSQDGFVCSSGFVVLRPERVTPEVLLTYLRLPLICELMDLHTSASMYPAISETDLLALPFAPPDERMAVAIRNAVVRSRAARSRSGTLLEAARRAVEIAIEQDEAAALRFLDAAEFS
jgi:hypothetical protein